MIPPTLKDIRVLQCCFQLRTVIVLFFIWLVNILLYPTYLKWTQSNIKYPEFHIENVPHFWSILSFIFLSRQHFRLWSSGCRQIKACSMHMFSTVIAGLVFHLIWPLPKSHLQILGIYVYMQTASDWILGLFGAYNDTENIKSRKVLLWCVKFKLSLRRSGDWKVNKPASQCYTVKILDG